MKSPADDLRQTLSAIDLHHPLCHRRKHVWKILVLQKGVALRFKLPSLSDDHNHRGRILEGSMDSQAGIGGAGTSSHKTDPRHTGQLTGCFGHYRHTRFVTATDCRHFFPVLVQGINCAQETFPGHMKHKTGFVIYQGVREYLCACPHDWN